MWRHAVRAAALQRRVPRARVSCPLPPRRFFFDKLKRQAKQLQDDAAAKLEASAADAAASARHAAQGLRSRATGAVADAAGATAAKAAELEASARGTAAELEASARGTAAELEASARGTATELEASARGTAAELEASARGTATELEASARGTAAELEASALGMQDAAEASTAEASARAADLEAALRARADGVAADVRARATEAREDTLGRFQATKEQAEQAAKAAANVATAAAAKAIKDLEGSRDQLLDDVAVLHRSVGLAAAAEFADEQRATIELLRRNAEVLAAELERARAGLRGGTASGEPFVAPALELLQVAALYQEHCGGLAERWGGWAAEREAGAAAFPLDDALSAKLVEFIDLADAVYEECAAASASEFEVERKGGAGASHLPGSAEGWEAVAADPTSAPGRPAFSLLLGDGRAVLAIRGTASVYDVLTDVLAAGVEYGGGHDAGSKQECQAHAGFVMGARGVLRAAGAAIEEHVLSAGLPLTVVGHSLGAGTAAVATLELLAQYPGRFRTAGAAGGEPGCELECFAFACPPVFSAALNARCSGYVTSVVHSDDAVCRGSLHGLVALLNEVAGKDTAAYTVALTEQALDKAAAAAGSTNSTGTGTGTGTGDATSTGWVVEQLRQRLITEGRGSVASPSSSRAGSGGLTWPAPPTLPLYPAGRILHLVCEADATAAGGARYRPVEASFVWHGLLCPRARERDPGRAS